MEITHELIQKQIPYYLSQKTRENLVKALNDFPSEFNYYTLLYLNEYLQGDGWSSFEVVSLETGEKKLIKGIVLSNSCDIDSKNHRDFPTKINFAPIVKLDSYLSKLENAGLDKQKIQDKVDSIRNQGVTTLFYLPQGGELKADYIALLDDIHTVSFRQFEKQQNKQKLFTLSQTGFYLFLLKLSVHFCRFQEQIERD